MIPILLLAAAAATPTFQDTAVLDKAVAQFTGQPIGAEGGARTNVDPRLKLASCPMVAMGWYGNRHDAVVVTCTGPDWRIFVPVKVAPPAVVTPAIAGNALPAAAARVAAPPVIKRGDPVMIEAGQAGFSITREGVALADAPAGGRFLVKVDDAKGPVQAVAIESGRATLPGWNSANQP